jgi:hypothetical protein
VLALLARSGSRPASGRTSDNRWENFSRKISVNSGCHGLSHRVPRPELLAF